MKYDLDSGEEFEIYREFNKKNPKIFNENGEDINQEFTVDVNTENCKLFLAKKVENVEIKESPDFIKRKGWTKFVHPPRF